jgi:hypothetical protein
MACAGGELCGSWHTPGLAQRPHVQQGFPVLVPAARVTGPAAAHDGQLQPCGASERHCEHLPGACIFACLSVKMIASGRVRHTRRSVSSARCVFGVVRHVQTCNTVYNDICAYVCGATLQDVGRFRIFGATLTQMPGWCSDLKYAAALGNSVWHLWRPKPSRCAAGRQYTCARIAAVCRVCFMFLLDLQCQRRFTLNAWPGERGLLSCSGLAWHCLGSLAASHVDLLALILGLCLQDCQLAQRSVWQAYLGGCTHSAGRRGGSGNSTCTKRQGEPPWRTQMLRAAQTALVHA